MRLFVEVHVSEEIDDDKLIVETANSLETIKGVKVDTVDVERIGGGVMPWDV